MKLQDGITNPRTLKRFTNLLNDFTAKHGDKYNYSKCVFSKMSNKLTIICPVHGEFEQSAQLHLNTNGCKKCTCIETAKLVSERNASNRETTANWVSKANAIHGNKYLYSLTEYTGVGNKLIITCPIHGDFEQVAYSHLSGHGCSKCANKLTTDQFIAKALVVHRGVYTYEHTVYTNWYDLIAITCPLHGEFQQEAHTHLRGHGCQKCATRGFKQHLPGILYYLRITMNGKDYYKIGVTNYTVHKRYTQEELQTCEILYVETFQQGRDCYDLEQLILNSNKCNRYNGPALLKNGNTEILTENVFDYTKRKNYEQHKTNTVHTSANTAGD